MTYFPLRQTTCFFIPLVAPCKPLLSYFNKNYVHTEIFPRDIGRKISRLEIIRHKSDYDTFYIASKEDAVEQVSVAEEVIELVERYLR